MMNLPGQSQYTLEPEQLEGMTLLGDLTLLRLEELPTESEGGIVLTEAAVAEGAGTHRIGEVVLVGTGWPDEKGVTRPPDVTVGQRVLIHRIAGDVVTVADKEYRMVPTAEMLAVVEDDE
jgi:co-chaperonin GroES (HSP10)